MRKYRKISPSFSHLITSEIFAVKPELDLYHIRLGFETRKNQQLSSCATEKEHSISTVISTALISPDDFFSRFAYVWENIKHSYSLPSPA